MGLLDSLKNRQKIKEETAKAEEIKNTMYGAWNTLIQDHNALNDPNVITSNDLQPMFLHTENSQLVNIGTCKIIPSNNNSPASYEFLLVYPQPDGQTTSSYYKLTPFGAFNEARGLGMLQVEYFTTINGKDIPCTAEIQTSTQELLNLHNINISPRVTPAISTYAPQQCMPNAEELRVVLEQFCHQAQLQNAQRHETTADFMPGTGRDF
jgi:hypothetical protein